MSSLTHEYVREKLGVIGKHPVTLAHTYLELRLGAGDVEDVELLSNFPYLMYLDVSSNQIRDLRVLENLSTLVQLNASKNALTECLDFCPTKCHPDDKWIEGDTAVGSMLTLANLSHNNIKVLRDLSSHSHLECLLLSNNGIAQIQGLSSLRYLQVLDLSYNALTKIENLQGLLLQELNLEGNSLKRVDGLDELPRLSVLNVSGNSIRSLEPLSKCKELRQLIAGDNQIDFIRQTEFLAELPWLAHLFLAGNPCSYKTQYRCRVLFRLPALQRLDLSNVSSEEKVRTFNLYQTEGGDLMARERIFRSHFPDENFEDFSLPFEDEELALAPETLLEDFVKQEPDASEKMAVISNVASTLLSSMGLGGSSPSTPQ